MPPLEMERPAEVVGEKVRITVRFLQSEQSHDGMFRIIADHPIPEKHPLLQFTFPDLRDASGVHSLGG